MSVTLVWSDEQQKFEVNDELILQLERILQLAAEAEGVQGGEVSLTFADNEGIQVLNKQFRDLDKPTDVLSFPMEEADYNFGEAADDELLLGDIVISLERAQEQADEYGHSFNREVGFLFLHGFLHLIGYDHQDESSEKAMNDKQEVLLLQAGLPR